MKSFYLIIATCVVLALNINSKKLAYQGNKNVEYCVSCKFIWENINEALSKNQGIFSQYQTSNISGSSEKSNPILISETFQYFCEISPDIFFEGCNLMFEKLFFMTQDFISGKEVAQICNLNGLCA